MSSVLITGASKGVGRAIAIELAHRGHRVIATARQPETLADLPVDQRLRLDVTDQDSVDQAVRAAGEVDVLVSNAGATVRAPLESVPLAEVDRLYQLNTLGALRVTQAVLPAMRERGSGRLVFVSSIQGRLVLPIIGPYGASKWALEAIAETLSIETRHFGISVSIVQPGAVATSGATQASRSCWPRSTGDYARTVPPSTVSTVPVAHVWVMQYRYARATSSTSPTRPAGIAPPVWVYIRSRSTSDMVCHKGERTTPGATAFTRTGASSTASERVSPSTAPQMLDATAQP
jgi:NADP-dependent 3-hydroxy acid dehydrogenase YdfG